MRRDKAEWMEEAKCRGLDPNTFFPRGSMQQETAGEKAAKRICLGRDGAPICPVINECRDYALEHNEIFGVWGGLTERERMRARRIIREQRDPARQARQKELLMQIGK